MNNILPTGTFIKQRYEIIELLSSNTGFGITYKVKDHDLHQQVSVLKQLKKPTASKLNIEHLPIPDQQYLLTQYWLLYLKFFDQETKALVKLGKNYNQIPTIYDKFEELGENFYVQEYIDGHSLSQEVKIGEKLSEKQTMSLLIEILEVFEYIQNPQNNQGYSVIHRDIKPENIIRRSNDQKLVIIDFGLVKEVTIPGTQIASIIGGTKGYTAPEMVLGKVSYASDIYSIGMIGVFAITGENPSANSTLHQDWQTKVNVSPEFAKVLNKMICENYKQRFSNAKKALQALRNITSDPSLPSIPWKLILSIISGIILAVGVFIIVISLSQKSNDELIADGTAKQGELTSSDQKELVNGRFYDVYTFNSTKKQYLTVQVVGTNFQPVVTVSNVNDQNFNPVSNVSQKDKDFTLSMMVEPGIYKFKITSENGEVGNYEIKGWLTNIK